MFALRLRVKESFITELIERKVAKTVKAQNQIGTRTQITSA
jgi:hypothetical protein